MPNKRILLLLVAATCFAAIGAALYLQLVKDMPPCPYCVIQRYAFLLVAIFCLIGASVKRPRPWSALALTSALAGAVVVGKHLYILAYPGLSCGIDPMESILNKLPTATYLPWLFQADGLCADARDVVLGLMVPQWSALCFAIVMAGLIATFVRRR